MKINEFVKSKLPFFVALNNSISFCRYWAILVSLILLIFLFHSMYKNHQYNKDVLIAENLKPQSLKVSLDNSSNAVIEYIRIEMPLGVYFYSEMSPEIREKKVFVIYPDKDSKEVPVLIKSEDTGIKELKVTFHDLNGQQVAEKIIKLKFL